jgi:hypothetical protein
MLVHITKKSANAKTGAMPVTTTEESSCPTTCPHLQSGGCYAKSGPVSWHWKKVSKGLRGGTWDDLTSYVSNLNKGQLWRHNQAGDWGYTTHQGREYIRLDLLKSLVDANKSAGAKGYTYTHHELHTHNLEAIKYANTNGFTVNASCESMQQADDAIAAGIPAVCVVDNSKPVPARTPAGTRVLVCPAQTSETNCKDCGICQQSNRKCVVAFLSHGSRAKKVNANLSTIVPN